MVYFLLSLFVCKAVQQYKDVTMGNMADQSVAGSFLVSVGSTHSEPQQRKYQKSLMEKGKKSK